MADLVTSEFFEQGDIERQELNITPIVSTFWASRLTAFYYGHPERNKMVNDKKGVLIIFVNTLRNEVMI